MADKISLAKSTTRLSSREPFRTFRDLDSKLSVLTGEQAELSRSVNGASTTQSRKLLKSMRATTTAITKLANRLERIYARQSRPFGVRMFRILGNRAMAVHHDLATLRSARTQNAGIVAQTKLDKDIIALVVQFQAVSGGHEATHCLAREWICCEPKPTKDLMPGQAAACRWSCLRSANRCTGFLGPRIRPRKSPAR